jgi:hypothetical protein
MSERIDNCCDVCLKRVKPAFDQSATLYRSYSCAVNHWDPGEIYVDDDEENRLQTCESCETVRQAAPELLKRAKRLLAYLDKRRGDAGRAELKLRHLLQVEIAKAEGKS